MSVKGFLDKYFKPDGSVDSEAIFSSRQPKPKTTPFSILEPSVPVSVPVPNSTAPRQQIESKQIFIFHIFTDGACSDNGRRGARGGFGVHFYSKKGTGLDLSEPLMNNEPQTNNRGELRAIQAALDVIDKYDHEWSKIYDEYCIWSDSEYSIHSLTKWAAGWRRNGWKKSDGGLIQNIDLIKPVYEKLTRMPRVRIRHVRAHQRGRENEFPFDGNTEADRLARASLTRSFLKLT